MIDTKKIRFVFSGGLGCQLFQYVAMEYLREKFPEADIEADFTPFLHYQYHNGIELQKILRTGLEKEIAQINSRRENGLIDEKPLRKFWNELLEKIEGYKTFYDENLNTPRLMDNAVNYNQRMILAGLYQNDKFLELTSHNISKRIIRYTPDQLGQKNMDLLDKIKGRVSVSVHLRRGNYADENNYDVFGDMGYYDRAIALMKERFGNPMFVVFSDDIEWAKGRIKPADDTVFVDWNRGKESVRDMIMMSKCDHNIIANSTFSWWGAWLNDNPDKIVTAPRQWFADRAGSDVVPRSWTIIDN